MQRYKQLSNPPRKNVLFFKEATTITGLQIHPNPKVINYDVKHKNTDGVHKNYDVKRINTDVVYIFFHPLRQKKTKKQMKSGGAMKKSWKKVCT